MRFLRAAAAAAISGSLIFTGGAPARAADGGPTIVDSGLPSGLVGAKPVITATVSDDLAVVRLELRSSRVRLAEATGANLTTVTLRPDLTALSGPMVELELLAYDAGGNSTRATSSVFVDAEFPAATLSPAQGASMRGIATITLSGVSADTVLATLEQRDPRLVLSQATSAPWTLTWNTVGSDDFPQVRLVDQAGNVTIYQPVWHADNELPVIGALSWKRSGGPTAPSGRAGGQGRFEVAVKDETVKPKVEFWVDGKLVSTDGAWNTGGANRTATVEVKARDNAGNTASRKFSVVLDNAGPSTGITAPGTNALIRGSRISSTVKATDPSGIAKAQLSGAGADTVAPYTSSVAAGKDGKRTLTWTVTDRVGNSTVVRRTVIVDNTRAKLTVTAAPKNKAKVKGTVKITAAASDKNGVAKVQLLVNGKVVATDAKAAYKFSLNTKKYGKKIKVQLRAYDRAGNVTTTTTRTWYRK